MAQAIVSWWNATWSLRETPSSWSGPEAVRMSHAKFAECYAWHAVVPSQDRSLRQKADVDGVLGRHLSEWPPEAVLGWGYAEKVRLRVAVSLQHHAVLFFFKQPNHPQTMGDGGALWYWFPSPHSTWDCAAAGTPARHVRSQGVSCDKWYYIFPNEAVLNPRLREAPKWRTCMHMQSEAKLICLLWKKPRDAKKTLTLPCSGGVTRGRTCTTICGRRFKRFKHFLCRVAPLRGISTQN